MLLILGALIFIAVPIVFSIKIETIDVPEYETYLCKGAVRASEGMTVGNVTLEKIRDRLSRSNVKF